MLGPILWEEDFEEGDIATGAMGKEAPSLDIHSHLEMMEMDEMCVDLVGLKFLVHNLVGELQWLSCQLLHTLLAPGDCTLQQLEPGSPGMPLPLAPPGLAPHIPGLQQRPGPGPLTPPPLVPLPVAPLQVFLGSLQNLKTKFDDGNSEGLGFFL